MCQIAFIVLGILGLCGVLGGWGLGLGILIITGVQIICEIIIKSIDKWENSCYNKYRN